jgi:hypothetical protein
MYLFIQVENGSPINHPALPVNLVQAFGEIPPNWEPFLRVQRPSPGVYQILESEEPFYQKINGVWTDVWPLRDMTAEEKSEKQAAVINQFRQRPFADNWSDWTLDKESCTMIPPIPRPHLDETKIAAGIFTFWCGAQSGWRDTPVHPKDNQQYTFDFNQWIWIEPTHL